MNAVRIARPRSATNIIRFRLPRSARAPATAPKTKSAPVVTAPRMPIAKPDPVRARTSSGRAVALTASPPADTVWLIRRVRKSRFWRSGSSAATTASGSSDITATAEGYRRNADRSRSLAVSCRSVNDRRFERAPRSSLPRVDPGMTSNRSLLSGRSVVDRERQGPRLVAADRWLDVERPAFREDRGDAIDVVRLGLGVEQLARRLAEHPFRDDVADALARAPAVHPNDDRPVVDAGRPAHQLIFGRAEV